MKKGITIVLTMAAALTLAFSGNAAKTAHAQAAYTTLTATDGYNPQLVATALAAAPSADEQALLAAVNALRAAKALPPLQMDPALYAAAYYQQLDALKRNYSGNYVYKADGATTVGEEGLVADFGSPATDLHEDAFSNGFNLSGTGNWPNTAQVWFIRSVTFRKIVTDPSLNACGVCLVNTGTTIAAFGRTFPVLRWTLIAGSGLTPPVTVPPTPVPPTVSSVPLYSLNCGASWFFLTASPNEDSSLAGSGWGSIVAGHVYAGAGDVPGLTPLYRLYYPGTGDHFYTTSAGERDSLIPNGYHYEGIACYVFPSQVSGSVPLYRAYNPQTGQHRYTTDGGVYNALSAPWQQEGVQAYVLP